MSDDHGACPHCKADLNGGLIWDYFYKDELGKGLTPVEANKEATKIASFYGATKTKGKWGREIGIYDMGRDRTVRWKCPDCGEEWAA